MASGFGVVGNFSESSVKAWPHQAWCGIASRFFCAPQKQTVRCKFTLGVATKLENTSSKHCDANWHCKSRSVWPGFKLTFEENVLDKSLWHYPAAIPQGIHIFGVASCCAQWELFSVNEPDMSLFQDLEEVKRDIRKLKEFSAARAQQQQQQQPEMRHHQHHNSEWDKFRGWVPSLTNPKRVNKLTKWVPTFFAHKLLKICH